LFCGKNTDKTELIIKIESLNRKYFSIYFLGARLYFPDRHTWAIWAQDDYELSNKESPSQASGGDYQKQRSSRRNGKSKITTTDHLNTNDDYNASMVRSVADDDLLLVDKVIPSDESEQVSFLHPTFGFLSRAHLTCGVAPGVTAAQTGSDMLEMIQQESDIIQRNTPIPKSDDERTVMRFFGNGHCIVYMKEPIPIETIFTGCFH
jgi:hypothetical protein